MNNETAQAELSPAPAPTQTAPTLPVPGSGARIDTLDVAKGIGILLVIVGHLAYSAVLVTYIYQFHMPMFFILSGMTFRADRYRNFGEFLLHKWKTLLCPYLFFCGLTTLYHMALGLLTHMAVTDLGALLLRCVGWTFWAPSAIREFNAPLWFVPCLFLVELLYYWIERLSRRTHRAVGIVLCLLLAVLGWVMLNDVLPFDCKQLPWNFGAALYILPLFLLGQSAFPLFVKKLGDDAPTKRVWRLTPIALLCAVVIYVLLWIDPDAAIGVQQVPMGLLFALTGVLGTVLVLWLSRLLCRSRFLRFLGRGSFAIMGVHILIQNAISAGLSFLGHRGLGVRPLDNSLPWESVIQICLVFGLSVLFLLAYNAVLKRIKAKSKAAA